MSGTGFTAQCLPRTLCTDEIFPCNDIPDCVLLDRNADQCASCSSQTFLDSNNQCQPVTIPISIENCARVFSLTQCFICDNNFFLNDSSTCSPVTQFVQDCREYE